ncbi:hypothetical protein ACLOJK_024178, partial [Asimina triloba]
VKCIANSNRGSNDFTWQHPARLQQQFGSCFQWPLHMVGHNHPTFIKAAADGHHCSKFL